MAGIFVVPFSAITKGKIKSEAISRIKFTVLVDHSSKGRIVPKFRKSPI